MKDDPSAVVLTGREAFVVSVRLLLRPPASLDWVAGELGVSRERVRQIEAKVAQRIRLAGGRYHPVQLDQIR